MFLQSLLLFSQHYVLEDISIDAISSSLYIVQMYLILFTFYFLHQDIYIVSFVLVSVTNNATTHLMYTSPLAHMSGVLLLALLSAGCESSVFHILASLCRMGLYSCLNLHLHDYYHGREFSSVH